MHDTYKRLEKEGVIGPMEPDPERGVGQLKARPFAEYPKWVYPISPETGKPVPQLVNSQREELLVLSRGAPDTVTVDPVVDERNQLAKQVAELQAKLALYKAGEEAAPVPEPAKAAAAPAPTPAKPTPAKLTA